MAKQPFSYLEEKSGLLEEYIAANPVHYRRNYPKHVEILTGDDIPTEQSGIEENGI